MVTTHNPPVRTVHRLFSRCYSIKCCLDIYDITCVVIITFNLFSLTCFLITYGTMNSVECHVAQMYNDLARDFDVYGPRDSHT